MANEIQWEPRVPQQKILQLYQTDAQGIHDEALIDDVGYALLARCESMRIVSDAYRGRIACPHCATLIIEDNQGPSKRNKQQVLDCPACDWKTTWGDYHKTFQGKQLRGQNFEPELDHYLQHFPNAKTPAQKMLLIDRLIHAVHKGTAKPAATNLLSGSAGQLTQFLDKLAYGEHSTSGLKQTKSEWDKKLRSSKHWSKKLKQSE